MWVVKVDLFLILQKKHNPKVKSILAKKILGKSIPLKHSMNLKKLHKLIND